MISILKKSRGGKFVTEGSKKEELIKNDFEMGIYPVTNSQYERFINAGGYENKDYWLEEGWVWREIKSIKWPGYWNYVPDCLLLAYPGMKRRLIVDGLVM